MLALRGVGAKGLLVSRVHEPTDSGTSASRLTTALPLPLPPRQAWLDCGGQPIPGRSLPFSTELPSTQPVTCRRASSSMQCAHQRGPLPTEASNLLLSVTGMLVRTRPPASLQILAATLSKAKPRRPNIPARAKCEQTKEEGVGATAQLGGSKPLIPECPPGFSCCSQERIVRSPQST